MENHSSVPSVYCANDLWYIGDRLLIPRVTDVRETIYRLAHDCLGHFDKDKSFLVLKDDYYWPNMRRDLEQTYILGCAECQRNKSPTHKHGLLHLLLILTKGGTV
jgi:hypothetical protein